jgi:hypothetical protein
MRFTVVWSVRATDVLAALWAASDDANRFQTHLLA